MGDGMLPEPAQDLFGTVVTGPLGLLRLLETQLGIPDHETAFTTRLIQYLGCIDRLGRDRAFYGDSYAADPFSTARTLLKWRDAWYEAGWDGCFPQGVPERLADMAAIETLARDAVDPGPGQRLQRVIALLADNPVAISEIRLRDRLEDFPRLWQRLLQALPAEPADASSSAANGRSGSDLRALQDLLLADAAAPPLALRGDGSLQVLRAAAPRDSARVTALLSRHLQEGRPDMTLAVLAEQRGDQLDEAMEGIGMPRLGFSARSPWRPVFQVLPLACELLWEPLNPTALFQFLSHPVGPIPRRARRILAATVAEVPGIGGPDWERAKRETLESAEDAGRLRAELDYWLEPPRVDPATGVDGALLAERATRVAAWLTGLREASDQPPLQALYGIAINQATELVSAIGRLADHGRERLPRDAVLRLIDDVRGLGAPVADRQAECCPGLPSVLGATHAAGFHDPVDVVIWWDCQATDRIKRWPWTRGERAALAAQGVELEDEEARLGWLGRAWLRPVLAAREQCLFVLHDDAELHHPAWDRIACLARDLAPLPVGDGEEVPAPGLSPVELEARALPPRERWWQLRSPPPLQVPTVASYSSLDAWIHSPYQWLLRYAARIRPGTLTTLSDGSTLRGRLAHRLFERFFRAQPDPGHSALQDIPAWVDEQVPTLLQQEGALLLEAGRQAECERFIAQLQLALEALLGHLQQAGVVRVEMELQQHGAFAGGELQGVIDLLASDGDGREAIVDIKWGGRRYRRESLLAGSYLQLATYSQLRRTGGAPPHLSYFIVENAHMLNVDHDFFPEGERVVPQDRESPEQYWRRCEFTWQWRRAQLEQGLVEVTVTGTEPDDGSQPGERGLLLPDASDAFNDYAVLTGWEPRE